jgi:hypothetical protein
LEELSDIEGSVQRTARKMDSDVQPRKEAFADLDISISLASEADKQSEQES